MSLPVQIPNYLHRQILHHVKYPKSPKNMREIDYPSLYNCRLVCHHWDALFHKIMNTEDFFRKGKLTLIKTVHSSVHELSSNPLQAILLLRVLRCIPSLIFDIFKNSEFEKKLIQQSIFIYEALQSKKKSGSNFLYLKWGAELIHTAGVKGIYKYIRPKSLAWKLHQLAHTRYDTRQHDLIFSNDFYALLARQLPQNSIETLMNSFSSQRDRLYLLLKGLKRNPLSTDPANPYHLYTIAQIKSCVEKSKEDEFANIDIFYGTFLSQDLSILNLGKAISQKKRRFYLTTLYDFLENKILSRSMRKDDRMFYSIASSLYFDKDDQQSRIKSPFSHKKYLWVKEQFQKIDLSKYNSTDDANKLIVRYCEAYDALCMIEGQTPYDQHSPLENTLKEELAKTFIKPLGLAESMIKGYCLLNLPDQAFELLDNLKIVPQDFSYLPAVASMMIRLIHRFPDHPESKKLIELLAKSTHYDYDLLKQAVLLDRMPTEALKADSSQISALEQKIASFSNRVIASSLPLFKALLITTSIHVKLENDVKAFISLSRAHQITRLKESSLLFKFIKCILSCVKMIGNREKSE
ncbi:MAG: hypothetical protein QRY72_05010 [Candidatus Rhabdochlamydia sp.]